MVAWTWHNQHAIHSGYWIGSVFGTVVGTWSGWSAHQCWRKQHEHDGMMQEAYTLYSKTLCDDDRWRKCCNRWDAAYLEGTAIGIAIGFPVVHWSPNCEDIRCTFRNLHAIKTDCSILQAKYIPAGIFYRRSILLTASDETGRTLETSGDKWTQATSCDSRILFTHCGVSYIHWEEQILLPMLQDSSNKFT